jgi:hypothetical protein
MSKVRRNTPPTELGGDSGPPRLLLALAVFFAIGVTLYAFDSLEVIPQGGGGPLGLVAQTCALRIARARNQRPNRQADADRDRGRHGVPDLFGTRRRARRDRPYATLGKHDDVQRQPHQDFTQQPDER